MKEINKLRLKITNHVCKIILIIGFVISTILYLKTNDLGYFRIAVLTGIVLSWE